MLVLYVRVVVTFGDVFGSRRARQIDQGQTAPVVHASPLAVMVSWFTEVEARVRTAQNAEPRNLSSPPPPPRWRETTAKRRRNANNLLP
jgi:hypothetical protein